MFKRSTSHRSVPRLGAAVLGIAVLFGGATVPVLEADDRDDVLSIG